MMIQALLRGQFGLLKQGLHWGAASCSHHTLVQNTPAGVAFLPSNTLQSASFRRHEQALSAQQAPVRAFAVYNRPKYHYEKVHEPSNKQWEEEPTNYIQLLGCINHAGSLDRLQYLVRKYGDKFDAIHLATAFKRLPHVLIRMKVIPTGVVVASPGTAVAIPIPGAPIIGNGAVVSAQLVRDLTSLLPAHASKFVPRNIGDVIYSLGEAWYKGVQLPPARDLNLEHVLLTLKRNNYQLLYASATTYDVGKMLKGLSRIRYTEDPHFIDALARYIESNAADMQDVTIPSAAMSLYMLGKRSQQLFATILNRAIEHRIFNFKGISELFLLCALLRTPKPELFEVLEQGIGPQIVEATPHQVATIIACSAAMGYKNEPMLQILADKAVKQIRQFRELDIALALEGCARLRFYPTALFDAVTRSITRAEKIKSDIKPKAIAKTLGAYARAGIYNDDVRIVFDRMLLVLRKKLRYTTPDDMALTAFAVAQTGHNDEAFMQKLVDRATEAMPYFKGRSIMNLLRALRKMQRSELMLVAACASRTLQLAEEKDITPTAAVEILYECSLWKHFQTELADAVVQLAAATDFNTLSTRQLCKLSYACHSMQSSDSAVIAKLTQRLKSELGSLSRHTAALAAVVCAEKDMYEMLGKLCDVLLPAVGKLRQHELDLLSSDTVIPKLRAVKPEIVSAIEQARLAALLRAQGGRKLLEAPGMMAVGRKQATAAA